MIHLYTASTPNGHKISCLLEALEMPYEIHSVNLGDGDQHKPDFLKISPNNKNTITFLFCISKFNLKGLF